MPSATHSSPSTSVSLIQRLRAKDPNACSRFAIIYSPLVYSWARRGGLQPSDAEDISQDVFRTVFAKIANFQKDGQPSRFRAWLWAIARNCVRLHYRQRASRTEAAGGSEAARALAQVPAVFDREEEPSTADDRRALMHRALHAVKEDFSESTWQAFWRVVIEGHPVAEVAADLELAPTAVRQAKYRVLCRLRDELADS